MKKQTGKKAKSPQPQEARRWKILIADDNEDFVRLLEKSLRLEGDIDVLTESHGWKVADAAVKWMPDLITLDIWFDRTDNADGENDVFPEIRRRRELDRVPVLMLTTKMSEEDVDTANGLPQESLRQYALASWKPARIIGIIRRMLKSGGLLKRRRRES